MSCLLPLPINYNYNKHYLSIFFYMDMVIGIVYLLSIVILHWKYNKII